MFIRIACLAVLLAAFTAAVPLGTAQAQTATTKEDAKAKAAEEKKAVKAEKKAKKKSDRAAARTRQKECGAEWKEARKAGKVEKYMTWPKYYSACNKRLKEKAA